MTFAIVFSDRIVARATDSANDRPSTFLVSDSSALWIHARNNVHAGCNDDGSLFIDNHLHADLPPHEVSAGAPALCRPEPCVGRGGATSGPAETLQKTAAVVVSVIRC